ncbi:MAG TPA: hypothetical protein VGN00_18855 [Puia sp.]|jgi:hypothetical protein
MKEDIKERVIRDFGENHSRNKISKQTLGFFSISVAWTTTMVICSIYQVIRFGKTQDIMMIVCWSGLFAFMGWAIFIIFPLARLDHSRKIFRIQIFPFVTTAYGVAVYSLFLLVLFRSVDLVIMFIVWAVLIGLIFGLVYSLLISSDKLTALLSKIPFLKILSPLSPLLLVGFFWCLLPGVFPNLVFRFMPEQIQQKIAAHTLSKFKKGDRFSTLNHLIPGYLENDVATGDGSFWSTNGLFDLKLEVQHDTIQAIELRMK